MKKKEKGILDLSEIKSMGNKRRDWGNSTGANIYYTIDGMTYRFLLCEYNKDKQMATLMLEGNKYNMVTGNILECCFGNILGTCVKDFRYSIGEEIKTKRKRCLILNKFRNKKGKKSYTCKCIDCGNIKDIDEDHMENRGFVCNVCSDKISYPERFVGAFLSQLNIKYDYQKRFIWSKNIKHSNEFLSTDKIYDYYIPSINTIIEVHGEVHYKEGRWSKSRPIDEVKENDKLKKKIALENGIYNYIILNCEVSDSDYIKNSIINSKLNDLFNLSLINWDKCALDSTTSLMRVCSDLWNDGIRPSQAIADEVGISKQTVITYLKKFAKLGLNDYNPRQEIKSGLGKLPPNTKEIIALKDDMVLGVFKSAMELARVSKEVLGVKLVQGEISRVARGERRHSKGYQFKCVEDLTDEEKIKYNIESKAS